MTLFQSKHWVLMFVPGLFLACALLPPKILSGIPLCYFHQVSGLNCPGCGLTRAFFYFFHGDFYHAILMNALSPVLILWFSLSFLAGIYRVYHGQSPTWYSPQGHRMISRLFLVLFLSQWIVGNLG